MTQVLRQEILPMLLEWALQAEGTGCGFRSWDIMNMHMILSFFFKRFFSSLSWLLQDYTCHWPTEPTDVSKQMEWTVIHLKTSRLFLQSLGELIPSDAKSQHMSQYHQELKLLYCSLKAVSRPSKDDLVVWRPFAAFMRILPSCSRTIRLKPNRTRSCVLVCKLANGCQWKVYVYLGLGFFFNFTVTVAFFGCWRILQTRGLRGCGHFLGISNFHYQQRHELWFQIGCIRLVGRGRIWTLWCLWDA